MPLPLVSLHGDFVYRFATSLYENTSWIESMNFWLISTRKTHFTKEGFPNATESAIHGANGARTKQHRLVKVEVNALDSVCCKSAL